MKYPGDRLTCRHWSMNCRLDWVTRRPRAPCVAVHHHIVCLWVYGSGDLRYQHRNGSMFVRVWEPSEAGSGTCHGMMFKAGWRLRFTHRSASPGSLQWPCAESWRLIRSCVCVRAMADTQSCVSLPGLSWPLSTVPIAGAAWPDFSVLQHLQTHNITQWCSKAK